MAFWGKWAAVALICLPGSAFAQSVTGGTSEVANFRFAPDHVQNFTADIPGVVGTMESGHIYSRSSKNEAGVAYIFSVTNASAVAVCVTFTFEHRGFTYPDFDSDRIVVRAPAKSKLFRFESRYDSYSSGQMNSSNMRNVVMTTQYSLTETCE